MKQFQLILIITSLLLCYSINFSSKSIIPSKNYNQKYDKLINQNKKQIKSLENNENIDLIAALLPGDPMVTGTVSLGILNAISLYSNVLLVRFALSWFPQLITQFPILRPVLVVTDPYLRVFRQVIPPVGGFDISSIAALFALNILSNTAAAIGDEGPSDNKNKRKTKINTDKYFKVIKQKLLIQLK